MTDKEKQTEEKILDAAAEVFEEKGMDGARMQEIADRAGINKSLLHYYYRNKEKLFKSVFNLLAKRMFSKFLDHFKTDMPFEDKIRMFYKEHISFIQKNPKLPAFIINEISKNPKLISELFDTTYLTDVRRNLIEQYEQEVKEGKYISCDPYQLMTNIISLSIFPFLGRGIIEVLIGEDKRDFDTFTEERKSDAAEFVLRSIRKE